MDKNIGFIGAGHMGNPIARHLIRAGSNLTVHDKRPEAIANLIELGATWADSPAQVAQQSDVVFTSLPGPPQVDEAVLGENGLLQGARDGMVHVDLSTNLPSAVQRLAQIEASRGVAFLDAPLSGMAAGAAEGTLTVFVGGDEKTFQAVEPLLGTFGKNIFYIGPQAGLGNIMKLANNLMVNAIPLLVDEALVLGVKAGIDAKRLFEIWNVSSASRFVQGIPRLLERDFDNPSFTLALSAKDVGLAAEAGRELGVPMPVTSAAAQVLTRSVAAGLGDKSPAAVIITIEDGAGTRVS
jgi:3-hydroxyisobutyrate dehydrogenase-like beta-hydroxyacid dehydrogenase